MAGADLPAAPAAHRDDSEGAALDAVRAAQAAVAAAEAALVGRVAAAREAGASWARLGEVLGVTRQAAFKRFGSPVDPETGEPLDLRPTADVTALAADVVRHLADGDHAWVRERMTYACARELSGRRIMDVWRAVLADVGAFEAVVARGVVAGDGSVRDAPGPVPIPAVARLLLDHEAGRIVARVAVNRGGTITGLLLGPPDAEAHWPF